MQFSVYRHKPWRYTLALAASDQGNLMTAPRFVVGVVFNIPIDTFVIAFLKVRPPIMTYFDAMLFQHIFDTIQTNPGGVISKIQNMTFFVKGNGVESVKLIDLSNHRLQVVLIDRCQFQMAHHKIDFLYA